MDADLPLKGDQQNKDGIDGIEEQDTGKKPGGMKLFHEFITKGVDGNQYQQGKKALLAEGDIVVGYSANFFETGYQKNGGNRAGNKKDNQIRDAFNVTPVSKQDNGDIYCWRNNNRTDHPGDNVCKTV